MRSVWVVALLSCLFMPVRGFGEEITASDLEITVSTLEKLGLEDKVASALAAPGCGGYCDEYDSNSYIVRSYKCADFVRCGCGSVEPAPGNIIRDHCTNNATAQDRK